MVEKRKIPNWVKIVMIIIIVLFIVWFVISLFLNNNDPRIDIFGRTRLHSIG